PSIECRAPPVAAAAGRSGWTQTGKPGTGRGSGRVADECRRLSRRPRPYSGRIRRARSQCDLQCVWQDQYCKRQGVRVTLDRVHAILLKLSLAKAAGKKAPFVLAPLQLDDECAVEPGLGEHYVRLARRLAADRRERVVREATSVEC